MLLYHAELLNQMNINYDALKEELDRLYEHDTMKDASRYARNRLRQLTVHPDRYEQKTYQAYHPSSPSKPVSVIIQTIEKPSPEKSNDMITWLPTTIDNGKELVREDTYVRTYFRHLYMNRPQETHLLLSDDTIQQNLFALIDALVYFRQYYYLAKKLVPRSSERNLRKKNQRMTNCTKHTFYEHMDERENQLYYEVTTLALIGRHHYDNEELMTIMDECKPIKNKGNCSYCQQPTTNLDLYTYHTNTKYAHCPSCVMLAYENDD